MKASERGRKAGVARDARIAREVLAVLEGQSDVFKWLEERHKVAYLNRSVCWYTFEGLKLTSFFS